MGTRPASRRLASLLIAAAMVPLAAIVASCANVIGLDGVERVACVTDCGITDGQTVDTTVDGPRKHDGGKPGDGSVDVADDSTADVADAGNDASKDTGPSGCAKDTDCKSAMDPRCDLNTGLCVPCLPIKDNCPKGSVCKLFGTTYECAMGCNKSSDCPVGDGGATLSCCGSFCVDTATNASNCGMCGQACSSGHMATVTCAASVCNGTCAAGYADCDGNKLKNGCEVHTGGSDVANCGGCAKACSSSNVSPVTCTSGTCDGPCAPGYADCDGNKQTDGCEVQTSGTDISNCGGCGVPCSASGMATVTCTGGACSGACAYGYQNCDGNLQSNGCEVLTGGTDTGNCGGCGTTCSSNNMATVTCAGGVCNGTCNYGYTDCDTNKQTNGCEIATATDPSNCGGCGVVCSSTGMATVTCGGGACNGTCTYGYANCDSNLQSNGCETCTNCSSCSSCGGCGTTCPSCYTCSGATLVYTCCPYVFAYDGHGFVYETSVGGASLVGKKAHVKDGKDLDFEPMWARLDHSSVDFSQGAGVVRSKVIAAEDEIVYFDLARLTAIEHPRGYEVVSSSAIEWRQTLKQADPQRFYVLRTAALRTPIRATWMGAADVTTSLSVKDEVAARYDEARANYYDLDFGPVSPAGSRWLVIEGWKFKQDRVLAPGVPKEKPRLDVRQPDGTWMKALDLATPRGDKKAAAFDLSDVAFPTGRVEVRVYTGTHEDGHAMWYLDRVRLTDEAALPVRAVDVKLDSATLAFTRPPSIDGEGELWHPVRATDDGGGALRDEHLTYGSFTRYGDVRELLAAPDDRMVVMRRGDGVLLRFVGVPKARDGHDVTVFLETDLLFKPHRMFGETSPMLEEVLPLPFHGMGHYPPSRPFPSDAAHRAWLETYETRVYERGDTRWGP